jgi:hypothetical protein
MILGSSVTIGTAIAGTTGNIADTAYPNSTFSVDLINASLNFGHHPPSTGSTISRQHVKATAIDNVLILEMR